MARRTLHWLGASALVRGSFAGYVGDASAQEVAADLAVTHEATMTSDVHPSVSSVGWTLANMGPSDAADVRLVVTLPAGTSLVSAHLATRPCDPFDATTRQVSCPLGTSFTSGSSTAAAVTFTNLGNAAGSALEVQARVTSSTGDPSEANNVATVSVVVVGGPVAAAPDGRSADLTVVAVPPWSTGPFGPAGGSLSWNLFNAGPALAENLTVVFTFPEGVEGATGSVSTRPCDPFDPVTRQVTCSWPDPFGGWVLSPGVTFSLEGLVPGTRVTVEARVSSDTPDLDPTNNSSTNSLVIGGELPTAGTMPETGGSTAFATSVAGVAFATGLLLMFAGRKR